MVYAILGILCIAVAVVLVLAVMIQNSKGGGINSSFGVTGATQILGARRSNEFIEKLTWYLAGSLAVLVFVTNIVGNTASDEGDKNELRIERTINGEASSAPALPNPEDVKSQEGAPAPAAKDQPAPPAAEEKK